MRHCETGDSIGELVSDVVSGAVAGAAGGLVASWAMNRFGALESQQARERHAQETAKKKSGDDATVKTAEAISRQFGHPLSKAEKKWAGPAVHYGYGAAVGALYGGLAEAIPVVGVGLGIPYATVLWFLGDEVAVPTLGLGSSPLKTPPRGHADALAVHFAYGVVLDAVRRVVRHLV